MKLLKYSLLFLALFLGQGVFAIGEVTTLRNPNVSQNGATLSFDINIPNIEYAGFLVATGPDSTADCTYLYNEPFDFRQGGTYSKEYTTLQPNTNYYYSACAKDKNGLEYYGQEFYFKTLSAEDVSSLKIETISVLDPANQNNITALSKEVILEGRVVGGGLIESGFLISTDDNAGFLSRCNITKRTRLKDKSFFSSTFPIRSGESYTYHACGKNENGELIFGQIFNFTVPTATNNQSDSSCRIDYIEFSPTNSSNIKENTVEYQNFVNAQGKSINLIIHPKNKNDCKNVNIDNISIQEINSQKVFKIFGPNEVTFRDDGTFGVALIAGDNGCEGKVCKYGATVWYGKCNRNGSFEKPRIFRTTGSGPGGYACDKEEPSAINKSKGILEYEKRTGTKEWRERTSSDPRYVEGITPTYDFNSPCIIKDNPQEGYDENCYEFLAPIPGFSSTGGGVETTADGRVAVTNLSGFQLGDYIQSIFNIALGLLMVLSVIMIVFAGVRYMTAEAIFNKQGAKEQITSALTGLILALGIFLILETINPALLEINFGSNIKSVGIEVKQYDQDQLRYIRGLTIPSVLNYQQDKIFNDIGFLGYLYHQQGSGGAAGHLWNAVKNNNPHKDLPWGSISAELLTRQMINNGGQRSPRDFVTYFYEKFEAAKRKINTIPKENSDAIEKAAKDVGVDPESLKAMCLIETAGCKDPKTTNSFGYKGLFQFCDSECKNKNPNSSETWVKPFIRIEGANIYDPYENAYAAAKLLQSNIKTYNSNKNRILN